MTSQEFAASVALIVTVMALVSLVELAVPLSAKRADLPGRVRGNLAMNAQALLFAFLLNSAVAVAALVLPLASPQLMATAALPPWLQVGLGVLALDFVYGYVAHRTMHAWPGLWRFHRVHHSDPFVDATTTYRTHPGEIAWRHLWLFTTVWALGVPATAVVTFRVLSAINGIFEHANLRLAPAVDTALSWVWVTPNMHKIHHSRHQEETDTNYGNLLPLYDRLLGTFLPTARASAVEYGLEDAEPEDVRTMAAMLAMPWRPRGAGRGGAADSVSFPPLPHSF